MSDAAVKMITDTVMGVAFLIFLGYSLRQYLK